MLWAAIAFVCAAVAPSGPGSQSAAQTPAAPTLKPPSAGAQALPPGTPDRVILCFKELPNLTYLADPPSVELIAAKELDAFPTTLYAEYRQLDAKSALKEQRLGVTAIRLKGIGASFLEISVQVKLVPLKQTFQDTFPAFGGRLADVGVRVNFALYLSDPNGRGKDSVRPVCNGSADSYVPGMTFDQSTSGRIITYTYKASVPSTVHADALSLVFEKANAAIKKMLADKMLVDPAVDDQGHRALKARPSGNKVVVPVSLSNRLGVPAVATIQVFLPTAVASTGKSPGKSPKGASSGAGLFQLSAGDFPLSAGEKKTVEIELSADRKKELLQGNLAVLASVRLVLSKNN